MTATMGQGTLAGLPLYRRIQGDLRARVDRGDLEPGARIEPEQELMARYGVSRATIRSAFDKIEAMGLIVRKQGIGTFVRPVSNLSNPLNKFIDFFNLISENGCQPGYQQLSAKILPPSEPVAQALALTPDEQALTIEKLFFADSEPIIFCINHFPVWVFEPYCTLDEILQPGKTEPLDAFLKNCCHQTLAYYISSVQAHTVQDDPLPEAFSELDPHTPLLIIHNTGFNNTDRPVYQSIEYHPGNRMDFKFIRSP